MIPHACHRNARAHTRLDTLEARCIEPPNMPRPSEHVADARRRSRTLANAPRTRRENESNATPPPDPDLETRTLRYAFGKNGSMKF